MSRPKNHAPRLNPWRQFVGAMVPNWLMERSELSLGAKLCYGRLAQYAGKKGYAYPKMRTLGRALGVTDRQARSYVAELKKYELLDVVCFKASGRSNRFYFLNHPWMYDEEVYETTPESEGSRGPDEMEVEFGSNSGEVARPPEGYFRYHRKDTSGGTGRILPDLEEIQGRDSEKEIQSGASRRQRSETTHSGRPSGPVRKTEPSPELCDTGELSSAPPAEPPSLAKLEAVVETAKAGADDAKAVKAAKQKAKAERRQRASEKLKASKVHDQRMANFEGTNGNRLSKEMRAHLKKCEGLWLSGVRGRWAGRTFPAWSGKERGQCTQLLKLYPGDIVGQTLSYVITNWDSINERMFKGKGLVPTMGMVLKLHDRFIPEVETCAKVLTVKQEYEQWFKDNPRKLLAPQDLQQRYDAALPELKALGLD